MALRATPAERNESLDGEHFGLKLGDTVQSTHSKVMNERGVIRFIGYLEGETEMFVGLELKLLDVELSNLNVVSGTVLINNNAPIEVADLKVGISIQLSDNKKQVNDVVLMTRSLNEHLFGDHSLRSKVLAPGSHKIPFEFPPLPRDGGYTNKNESGFNQHLVRIALCEKSEKNYRFLSTHFFGVKYEPQDRASNALGWATKSESKNVKGSWKMVSIKATAPTGIHVGENIPIHISISNASNQPKSIIRSRLARFVRDKNSSPEQTDRLLNGTNLEEISIVKGEHIHYLQTYSPCYLTSDWPCSAITFRLELEVETENRLFKFEFPVVVGNWKNGSVRSKAPFEGLPEPEVEEVEAPPPNQVRPPTPPPRSSSSQQRPGTPIPPERLVRIFPAVPLTPSAPPLEPSFGTPPPTYEEAMRNSSFQVRECTSVRAQCSYNAVEPRELSFLAGDIIRDVCDSEESGWLIGTLNGQTGLVLSKLVGPLTSDN